jgi:hypothetical protein
MLGFGQNPLSGQAHPSRCSEKDRQDFQIDVNRPGQISTDNPDRRLPNHVAPFPENLQLAVNQMDFLIRL